VGEIRVSFEWRSSDLNMRREFMTVDCVDPIELTLFMIPSSCAGLIDALR
jgi:hypothetical protein